MTDPIICIENEYKTKNDWLQGDMEDLMISPEGYLKLPYNSVPLTPVNTDNYCSFYAYSPQYMWIEKVYIENQNGDILLDFNDSSYASEGYEDNTEQIIEAHPGDFLEITIKVNTTSFYYEEYLSWGHSINSGELTKIADLHNADNCPWEYTYTWEVPEVYGNHLISWWIQINYYGDCCGDNNYGERRDFTLNISPVKNGYLPYGYIEIPDINLDYICSVKQSIIKWDEVDINLLKLRAAAITNGSCNIGLKNIFARSSTKSSGSVTISKFASSSAETKAQVKLTSSPLAYSKVKISLNGGETWKYVKNNESIPGIKYGDSLKDINLKIILEIFSLRNDVNIRISRLFISVSGIKRIYLNPMHFPITTELKVKLTPYKGYFQGKVKKRDENAVGAKILAVNIDREIIDGVVNSDENGDFYIEVKRNEQYHIIAQYEDDEGKFHAKSFPFQYPTEIR